MDGPQERDQESSDYAAKRVLLVDDTESQLKLFSLYLRRLGMQVDSYLNPVEALQAVRLNPCYDIAVIDFEMPGMTGNMLEYELRSIPALRELPIIIATANQEKVRNYLSYQRCRRGETKAVDKVEFSRELASKNYRTINEVLAA